MASARGIGAGGGAGGGDVLSYLQMWSLVTVAYLPQQTKKGATQSREMDKRHRMAQQERSYKLLARFGRGKHTDHEAARDTQK